MDQNFRRYENPNVLAFVLNITKRLELAAKSLQIDPELINTNWKIHIFESAAPNAFSAGFGNLILTKSMIQACANEAELASILAHEMSHYYSAHSESGSSYSLEREIQADTLALSLIELAGYQLNASITALTILYRQGTENVSKEKQENLELRTENLTKLISRKNIWGITDSREFNRIKRSLNNN